MIREGRRGEGAEGRRALEAAIAALVLCAGCGLLETPDEALIRGTRELEAHPPSSGDISITSLRVDPPRLAPESSTRTDVTCSLWIDAKVGGTRLLFHGPDAMTLQRPSAFAKWALQPAFPRFFGIARALAARRPPAKVAAWAVGIDEPGLAEVREEYAKDAAGRPIRAAARLAATLKDGAWVVTVK